MMAKSGVEEQRGHTLIVMVGEYCGGTHTHGRARISAAIIYSGLQRAPLRHAGRKEEVSGKAEEGHSHSRSGRSGGSFHSALHRPSVSREDC